MSGSNVMDKVRSAQARYQAVTTSARPEFEAIKRQLHGEILESIDFEQINQATRDDLAARLRADLTVTVEERSLPLNRVERERLVDEILDDILGLGPLENLMRDKDITDILVNGCERVWIEKGGRLFQTDIRFQNDRHLMQVIDRIVSAVGRRVDETSPMVDARLPDGSRVNAIIPPLAIDGPALSIRRFREQPITWMDLVAWNSVPQPVCELLRACVVAKLNILVSGGTGSGKTTLLNVLSSFIPDNERIITIEDSAELRLQQPHIVRLETRPPNLDGRGEVNQRDLVRNALRMRPDRIILGEIRGGEAIDMLQAMNTGHEGSLGTLHANSPREALTRLETMVGLGVDNISDKTIRELIARSINVIVQLDRLSDGTRRLLAVTEIAGMEGPVVTTQEIFKFDQRTIDADGKVRGIFHATGTRPRFATKLSRYGITLPPELFRFQVEV